MTKSLPRDEGGKLRLRQRIHRSTLDYVAIPVNPLSSCHSPGTESIAYIRIAIPPAFGIIAMSVHKVLP